MTDIKEKKARIARLKIFKEFSLDLALGLTFLASAMVLCHYKSLLAVLIPYIGGFVLMGVITYIFNLKIMRIRNDIRITLQLRGVNKGIEKDAA